ncbi:SDR family NAD(P)-dependent oxidoreductase [Nocardioides sp. HDW12B]|uniref:SDR family oxidoreductase n=1 Tax=Nocardioides sp. HDW12B TaxID=2714939 RepID=UPI00140B86C3|nr:SDR family NAD(P)-dependent oxidoreductase [Nocardioides sp. HDW12B]QIK66181.1 SDR family NAD(P)-dependent oxidoreductase [Nocardioides sp. HDW12B]
MSATSTGPDATPSDTTADATAVRGADTGAGPRTALVVGAGPGVSGSLARLLAREGYVLALVGREEEVLGDLAEQVAALAPDAPRPLTSVADVTDHAAAGATLTRLAEQLGRVDLLHFNPSAYRARSPLELTPAELAEDVALGVGALLTAVQAAHPFLSPDARITVTGSAAADSPDPSAASLGVQKAGVRNLVRSLDRHLADSGVRAVSVTVDGVLAPKDPGSTFHPDVVASALLAAARQPVASWASEVRHPAR